MTRIPYPDPDKLSAAKREVYDNPKTLNISKMTMHAPDVFWYAQRILGQSLVYDSTIPKAHRELVILRTAYLCKSDYEIYHHDSIAKDVGVSDAGREAMRTGDFSALPTEERLIAQFTDELVQNVSPTDETLAAMREIFTLEQIFEMIITSGYYMMLARIGEVSGVDFDKVAVDFSKGRVATPSLT